MTEMPGGTNARACRCIPLLASLFAALPADIAQYPLPEVVMHLQSCSLIEGAVAPFMGLLGCFWYGDRQLNHSKL